MGEYKHILVAIDFSQETEQLLQQAALLREQCHANLSLIHVVEYVPMAYAGDLILLDGIDLGMERHILEESRQRMAEIGERLNIASENCRVILGPILDEVLRLIKETKVDLLIVGSHGRHGLALLFGSTVDAFLHQAECDMLAVRIHKVYT